MKEHILNLGNLGFQKSEKAMKIDKLRKREKSKEKEIEKLKNIKEETNSELSKKIVKEEVTGIIFKEDKEYNNFKGRTFEKL